MSMRPPTLVALGTAGAISGVISLTALAAPPSRPPAPVPALAGHDHAQAAATRKKVVRRCTVKTVKRAGTRRRVRVCRRVVVRVPVPTRTTTATTGATTATAAPTTTAAPPATTTTAPVTTTETTGATTTDTTTGSTAPAPPATFTVTASATFGFTPSTHALAAGPTTVTFVNGASIVHNLHLQPLPSGAEVVVADTDPGASRSITVTLTPGTWRVWCARPGHAAAGMDTTVTVS